MQPPAPPDVADWLPYGRFNLLRNPFGALSDADRVTAAIVDDHAYAADLAKPYTAIQFLGPCGTGKSTHLFALRRHYPDAAYVYLPLRPALARGQTPRVTIPTHEGTPLLVDEAQRLTWKQRTRLLATGCPLALGTHRDLTRALRRAGYRVRNVRVAGKLSQEQLSKAFHRRIELARLGPGPLPTLTREEVNGLRRRYGDDIRAMEHHLYDDFQPPQDAPRAEVSTNH